MITFWLTLRDGIAPGYGFFAAGEGRSKKDLNCKIKGK
jgi:hypothetical protein